MCRPGPAERQSGWRVSLLDLRERTRWKAAVDVRKLLRARDLLLDNEVEQAEQGSASRDHRSSRFGPDAPRCSRPRQHGEGLLDLRRQAVLHEVPDVGVDGSPRTRLAPCRASARQAAAVPSRPAATGPRWTQLRRSRSWAQTACRRAAAARSPWRARVLKPSESSRSKPIRRLAAVEAHGAIDRRGVPGICLTTVHAKRPPALRRIDPQWMQWNALRIRARESTRSSAMSGPASGNSRVPWPTTAGTMSRLISSTSLFSSSHRISAPLPCTCSSPPRLGFQLDGAERRASGVVARTREEPRPALPTAMRHDTGLAPTLGVASR
jgi:hypothetical protein